jgi:hypothetical protein
MKSVHLTQYHSASLGLSRFEYFANETFFVQIFDFGKGMRYEMSYNTVPTNVNVDGTPSPINCTSTPLNATSRFEQQRNFSSIFFFGDGLEEEYLGVKTVRGIRCNHWVHRFVDPNIPEFGGKVNANFTQDFYFAENDWNVDGLKRTTVPVMSIVAGTFNNTEFNHTYSFSEFRIGLPPVWQRVSLYGDCEIQQRIAHANDTQFFTFIRDDTGIAIGMLILGIIFGVCFTSIACICIARRRQRRMASH